MTVSSLAYSQVGINTPNPQGVLHVDGAKDNPATGTPTAAQQANDVVVNSAGNLGIGLTSPANKLDVLTTAAMGDVMGQRLRATSATASVGQSILIGFHPNTVVGGNAPWGIGAQFFDDAANEQDADFIFKSSAGAQYFNRMIIKNNGLVGIGTTTPASRLAVIDNFSLGAGYTSVEAPSNGAIIQGDVGIGTSAPTAKLEVASGTTGTSGLKFTNMTSSSPVTLSSSPLGVDATGNVVVQGLVQKARFKGIVTTTSLPANSSTSTGPFTQLSYTEHFDADNSFSTNTFTAPRTGYYIVNAHLNLIKSAGWNLTENELYLDIRVAGSVVIVGSQVFSVSAATSVEGPTISANGVVQMTAGQQLTVFAWMQNGGVARNISSRSYLSIAEL